MIKKLFLLTTILTLLVGGCRESQPEPPAPEEIVARAASRMSSAEGFAFAIGSSGAPIYVDAEQLLSLGRAEGHFVAPDRAQADVILLTPGFATNVSVISVGETQWQTNPLTGQWSEVPPEFGFDPAALFDSESGLLSVMQTDLSDLSLTALEQLEGVSDDELYAISGTLDGERVFQISQGLLGPAPMSIRMWIHPEGFELLRTIIAEVESEDAEPTD
jgi:outer membrane lipoprotein-sorting protein